MMKYRILIPVLLLLLPGLSRGQEKTAVAVLQFEPRNISQAEAVILSDRLRAELVSTNHFNVLEREQMDKILREQKFQLTGACSDASCLVQVGQLMAVSKMMGGTISKIGNTYTVQARVIDVERGVIETEVSQDFTGTIEDLSGFIYSWNRADNPKSAKSGGYQEGPVSLEAAPGEKLKLIARISPEIIFASMDAEIEYDQSLLKVKALEASDLWQGGDKPQLFLSKQQEGRTVISAAKWQEGQEPSGQLFSMSFEGNKASQTPVALSYRLYNDQGAEICSGNTALTLNAGLGIPGGFFLGRAAPNPSNRPVAVSYQLPRQARVKLEVYNIAGQQVATLVDAEQPAGYYSQTWDLKDRGRNRVANGIYFYQLSAGEYRSVGKMVVIR